MKKLITLLSAFGVAAVGFADAPPLPDAGFKVSGFLQYRMEYTENPRVSAEEAGLSKDSDYGPSDVDSKNEARTLVFLNIDNHFDGHTRFHGIVAAETLAGRTTGDYVKLLEGFVEANYGPAKFAVGRFMSDVGLGTLGGAPFMDGAHVSVGGEQVKAQVYLTKFGNPGQFGDYAVADKSDYTFLSADLKVMPVKGLTLSAAYFSDVTTQSVPADALGGQLYKDWALGFEYAHVVDHVPYFTLSGEYADNAGAMAKKINGTTGLSYAPVAYGGGATEGSDPKAYYAKLKILGANPFMPGTAGLYVQYRKADAGFDVMGMANGQVWNAPYNWTAPSGAGIADNEKGIEAGFEVTILPRCVFKASYAWMKLANTTSTLDVGSPALNVVSSVVPGTPAPTVTFAYGTQNRAAQNYATAAIFYIF